MGLDMDVYKVYRLSDEEIKNLNNKHIALLPDNINAFTASDFQNTDFVKAVSQLKPYYRIVHLQTGRADTQMIRRLYNIPSEWSVAGPRVSGDTCYYTFYNSDKTIEILLLKQVLYTRYIIHKTKPALVIGMNQLHHWYNESFLSECLAKASHSATHEGGYNICTPKMIQLMNLYGADINPDEPDIFYQEQIRV